MQSLETPDDVCISDNLTAEQKSEVNDLVRQFPDIFTDRPGLTNLLEHEIKTTTETPMKQTIAHSFCYDRKDK